MKLIPMKFRDFVWHHNPREIAFECEKAVNELLSPFDSSAIQETGRRNMIIRGEGELYGEDCLEQFEKLFELFQKSGQGVLSIPHISPIYAVFESLKIIGIPRPDVLTYSFVFREVMQSKIEDKPINYTVKYGENLWDVSYRFEISIDRLVELNPNIKRPDIVNEGEVVRLC